MKQWRLWQINEFENNSLTIAEPHSVVIVLHTKDQDEYLTRCFDRIGKKVKAKKKNVERLKAAIRSYLNQKRLEKCCGLYKRCAGF